MTNLAVVGECMLELSRIKDGADKTYNLRYGGDTLNVALYFARQGGTVDYVTAIGDDPFSLSMYDDWKCENIGVDLVEIIPNRQSGLYMVETDKKGERSFYYWRDHSPARDLFKLNNSKKTFKHLMTFEYLYFSGITLSLYNHSSLNIFYDFLCDYKNNNGQVVFDLNYRAAGWENRDQARAVVDRFIPFVDIALSGMDDEQVLTDGETPECIIERYRRFGVQEIIVKCGHNGCVIHHEDETEALPTKVISNPVDTTAAGDAFNGAYLAARLSGARIQDAVRCGQECASLVIMHPGAIIPK